MNTETSGSGTVSVTVVAEEKKPRTKSAATLEIEKIGQKIRADHKIRDAKAAREASIKKHDARVAKAEEERKALGE